MVKNTEDLRISKLDKEKLAERFTVELPGILEKLDLSVDKLSRISGISFLKYVMGTGVLCGMNLCQFYLYCGEIIREGL